LSPGAILPGVEFRLGHYQTLSPWEKWQFFCTLVSLSIKWKH
jgi:hypothetical protein